MCYTGKYKKKNSPSGSETLSSTLLPSVSLQVRHRAWIHPHRSDSHQCLTAIETSEKKMSPCCNVIIPLCSILGFALSLHKCFCLLAAIVLYYLEAGQTEMRPPSPFLCLLIQSSLARRCTHHRDQFHQRTHWIRSGGSPRSWRGPRGARRMIRRKRLNFWEKLLIGE